MSTDAPHRATDERGRAAMSLTPLDVRLDAVIDSVPKARHHLARWLNQARVDREIRDELGLVVTELVTNAVEASPGPNAVIELRAELRSGVDVMLVVTDRGPGFAIHDSPRLPGDTSIRGRGLPIVNALMDVLDVRRLPGQTEVTAVRTLPHTHL
jgi:anti-sigma regulatory factor (Ser/Thr protein kinase)